jgi:hypothetical protein
MKTGWVSGVVLAAAVLVVAATPPVAMRVEIEPLRQLGANTEVAVIIQIAPMDRSRIGSNAIVRVELDEGRVSSGSPMRAVTAADDGSFRVVVAWPPGEHDLRVGIEGPTGDDTGLWVGQVRIPDLGQGAAAQRTEEPKPVPAPVPPAETMESPAVAPQPAGEEPATGRVSEETAAEAPPAAAPTAAAVATTAEAAQPPPSVEPEVGAPKKQEPETEQTMTEPAPVEPEPVQQPEAGLPETPAVEPEAATEPEPEMPPTTIGQEEAASEVPAGTAEDAPLVEPLRAEPSPGGAEPETAEPGTPVRELSEPGPLSAAVASRYAEWERADPESREFSIFAMRGREPARGLKAGDLLLRVDGSEVPLEELGDDSDSPLMLGFAIDVLANDTGAWAGTGGSLAPIVDRAADGRGRLFVASSSGISDWDAEPGSSSTTSGSLSPKNVAGLVEAALERFEGERGRRFLVVLTDGRNEPTKDEWRRAADAAGEAGVPILVVALWDGEFSKRTRKQLRKLTDVSGGSLFLVQGRTQIASAADRFGRYIDGGYAIRFRMPSALKGGPVTVSVSATDRDITVNAPESIR